MEIIPETQEIQVPLLAVVDGETYENELDLEEGRGEKEGEYSEEMKENSAMEIIIYFYVSLSAIAAVVAMLFEWGTASVMLMGFTSIPVSLSMLFNQKQLYYAVSLQMISDRVLIEVQYLVEQNKLLKEEAVILSKTAGRLQDLETSLEQTTKRQIKNVSYFDVQVEQKRSCMKALQKKTQSKNFKYLIDACLVCDIDGNNELSDEESIRAIKRVKDIFGVEVNAERFLSVVVKDNRISNIIKNVRNRQELPEQYSRILK
mmetsp:Transcript_6101/g.9195  ORF Transcript_6101/g.9195 Transcript_6101/m.9195 type:complete len:260 (-) Transcript_6101:307-1086(-)|eukprot:CAMPEP_0194290100 /NCGR_PEP_ID=MMETSP0169-20130528/40560_1 /TAXON_ID=218684 /ORGANISM="Corethron pennatum, Strain L29A3" /LENGTH=259 /DNA_ID=CAMNT_0039037607 /DNA_START=95 /DNA_END=874 /DNA_ORIENTATION=+